MGFLPRSCYASNAILRTGKFSMWPIVANHEQECKVKGEDKEMEHPHAKIHDLLYRLGVTANYTGFFHTACAVQLCIEKPERLLLVTKWVYPDVAKQYRTSWTAVERNIRTVSGVIWRENRPLLEALACKPIAHQPGTAQLLAILTYALLSPHCSGPLPVHGLGSRKLSPEKITIWE